VAKQKDFVVVRIARGEAEASIIKSHLECEEIPVMLQFESVGRVLGLTVDGLGEIKILVPRGLVDKAKEIIEPRETAENSDEAQ